MPQKKNLGGGPPRPRSKMDQIRTPGKTVFATANLDLGGPGPGENLRRTEISGILQISRNLSKFGKIWPKLTKNGPKMDHFFRGFLVSKPLFWPLFSGSDTRVAQILQNCRPRGPKSAQKCTPKNSDLHLKTAILGGQNRGNFPADKISRNFANFRKFPEISGNFVQKVGQNGAKMTPCAQAFSRYKTIILPPIFRVCTGVIFRKFPGNSGTPENFPENVTFWPKKIGPKKHFLVTECAVGVHKNRIFGRSWWGPLWGKFWQKSGSIFVRGGPRPKISAWRTPGKSGHFRGLQVQNTKNVVFFRGPDGPKFDPREKNYFGPFSATAPLLRKKTWKITLFC